MTDGASARKTILVCGGRDFNNWFQLSTFLDDLQTLYPDGIKIISGGASGADFLAKVYCRDRGIEYTEYPAEWGRYGKQAGMIRNSKMLELGNPDLVVAFPGGKETGNMIKISEQAGIPVASLEVEGSWEYSRVD